MLQLCEGPVYTICSCEIQRFCVAIIVASVVAIIGAIVGALVGAIASFWILKFLLVCAVTEIALSKSSFIFFENICKLFVARDT